MSKNVFFYRTKSGRIPPMGWFVLLLCFCFMLLSASQLDADSAFDAVVRAVLPVSGRDASGDPVNGTAFLMQGRGNAADQAWLVTAAHILNRIKGEHAQVIMRQQNRGIYSPNPVLIKIRSGASPLYHFNQTLDLAAIKVALPGEVDACVLGRDFAADDARLSRSGFGSGVRVLIPGYPYGESCNNAGFAFVRSGVVSSFPVLPSEMQPVFYVDFEVFEGYSGAPVVFAESGSAGILVGMVLEEVFLEELRPRGKKTARTRRGLGLAKVLSGSLLRAYLASLP